MADPYVWTVDSIRPEDELVITVGVDYDLITVAGRRLTAAQMEEVAQMIVRATWEAARQADA